MDISQHKLNFKLESMVVQILGSISIFQSREKTGIGISIACDLESVRPRFGLLLSPAQLCGLGQGL